MLRKLSTGKIIAGAIALAIALIFWNIFFPPGGSGANILLGVFVAVFFVYYFSAYVGGWIDQEFFPGGSKTRARSYRALERYVRESTEHLTNIKRSKSKVAKCGPKAIENFEARLKEASEVLARVKAEWDNKNKIAEHERLLHEANTRLHDASKTVFKLDRNWRFLYGMPSLILALVCALFLREFLVEPYQIPSGSMYPSLVVGDHLFVKKYYYGLLKPFSSEPGYLIRFRDPKPGDVVIFKAPSYVGRHANQAWIKRVIAVEGQSIKILNHVIYVDNKPYEHIEPETIVKYMDFFGFGGPSGGVWKEQTSRHSVEKIGSLTHQIYMPIYAPAPALGPNWPPSSTGEMPGLKCEGGSCTVKPGYVFVMGDNRGNSTDSRYWGALAKERILGNAWFIWMSVDGSKQSINFGPLSFPSFRFDRWFTTIH